MLLAHLIAIMLITIRRIFTIIVYIAVIALIYNLVLYY